MNTSPWTVIYSWAADKCFVDTQIVTNGTAVVTRTFSGKDRADVTEKLQEFLASADAKRTLQLASVNSVS